MTKPVKAIGFPKTPTQAKGNSLITSLSSKNEEVVLEAIGIVGKLIYYGKKDINDKELFSKLTSLASKTGDHSSVVRLQALIYLTQHIDKIERGSFQHLEDIAIANLNAELSIGNSIDLLDALHTKGFIPVGNERVLSALIGLAGKNLNAPTEEARQDLIAKLLGEKVDKKSKS